MKKKHRDIVVGGIKYGWVVNPEDRLTIYLNKKVFNVIDIHNLIIKPRHVADYIKRTKIVV